MSVLPILYTSEYRAEPPDTNEEKITVEENSKTTSVGADLAEQGGRAAGGGG